CRSNTVFQSSQPLRWDLSIILAASPGDCNLFSTMRCIIVRTPINFTMYLAFSGTFMLSIERCIATRKLSTYDKNRLVGPILVLIQVSRASFEVH
ncbi:hypothetical protein OSTOST_14673, partial [Ostertagia ostertagi]